MIPDFESGLDIHMFVLLAFWLTILAIIVSIWSGFSLIFGARKVKFFRIRQERALTGWRRLFQAILLAFFALFLRFLAEPIAYHYFPPTVTSTATLTPSLSPTITLTPTITETPTITLTPAESYTPTATGTPFLPSDITFRFTSTVTPNPDTVFSELIFASKVDEDYRPLDPGNTFSNPIRDMYAIFSYDKMITGVQFTALWLREGQLAYFETYPWDGSTGGYGYSNWHPVNQEEFLPGTYQVQIFVGQEWYTAGSFTLEGIPPTSTYTPVPTPTIPTRTPRPTATPRPTQTPRPTRTPTLTRTATATRTATLTRTSSPQPTGQ